MTSTALRARRQTFVENWLTLNLYERFEQVITLVLTAIIAVIIVMSIWDLSKEVLFLGLRGALDPLDHRMFQAVFGQILTVLIALEFKHSLIAVVSGGRKIIQVKTVLLIGLLALARKFIILDPNEYSAGTILALAAVLIALSAAYWVVRDRDAREAAQ